MREQNALPYEAWTTTNPLAKDDVNNVGAGRAAKGAIPVDRTKIGHLCEINAYLIGLMRSKILFLIKTLVFGVHFGVHISIFSSPYNKSPSSTLPEELFSLLN